ncbi:MAG TPA: hypothetical protein VGI39_04130 [Polyangiaceae bacterium]|jgi:hypothetical protein
MRPSPRPSSAVTLTALSLLAAVTTGCSSKKNGASPSSVACPAPSEDGGVPAYETFAIGSANAPGVSLSFCNAEAQVESNYGPILFSVDSTTASFATAEVHLPAGAVGASITGSIGLEAPAAGVYKSSDANACGGLTLRYETPLATQSACQVDANASCPTGCTSTYFCGNAQGPCCVPLATAFAYQAAAASVCTGGGTSTPQPALGDWTLTLTSVTPYVGDAGPPYGGAAYLAHGTLTAHLQGTADTTDSAEVDLTF